MTKIDQTIEDMYLYGDNSKSLKEVIEKIFQAIGILHPMWEIVKAIKILRKAYTKDPTKYGWVFQYVKSGANIIGDNRWKIYRLGAPKYIPSTIELQSAEDGILNITEGEITKYKNLISQAELRLQTFILSPSYKDWQEELIDMWTFSLKTCTRMAGKMQATRPRKAASGGGSNGNDPISGPLTY